MRLQLSHLDELPPSLRGFELAEQRDSRAGPAGDYRNDRSLIGRSTIVAGRPSRRRADQSQPQAGHVNHAITRELSGAASTAGRAQRGHGIVNGVSDSSEVMTAATATVVPIV